MKVPYEVTVRNKKGEIVYPELLEVLMTYGGYEKLPEFQP